MKINPGGAHGVTRPTAFRLFTKIRVHPCSPRLKTWLQSGNGVQKRDTRRAAGAVGRPRNHCKTMVLAGFGRRTLVSGQSPKMFKKSSKKMLTPPLRSGILATHTVTTEHNTQKKMRTKTLIMSAVALLAAGIVSTQAQVYSQNVVGYASVATPSGANYLLTIPFAIGVSNGANEIWPLVSPGVPSIPDGSSLLLWNSASLTYTTYLSDSTSPVLWDDNNGNYLTGAPVLPVGKGFFLNPAGSVTNTFAGTVVVNVGTSNVMTLAAGADYLVGCVVPYAGFITNGNNSTGGPNLDIHGGLTDGSSLLVWNRASLTYTTYLSDSTSPSLWDDNNGNYLAVPPSITVGQGYFINPAGTFSWTVGL